MIDVLASNTSYDNRVVQGLHIYPEVSCARVPSTKKQWDFSKGFWKIARNKVCGKQTCLINARFVQPDNIHMSTLLL